MDEIKEIAKHIIALYSTDTDYAGVRKIVQEYYAEEAVYQNAAFSVTGRENIIAHVIWTKSIFDSSGVLRQQLNWHQSTLTTKFCSLQQSR
jgi:hypothetical protein